MIKFNLAHPHVCGPLFVAQAQALVPMDGDAHAASVSEMASADRPQSDTPWRWKTRPSQPRWQGHWFDGTSCTTSSGSR